MDDGKQDYRKFILYAFVHLEIDITMATYHFANDMVNYEVLQDWFKTKNKMAFTAQCVEESAEFIIDQFNQWTTNKKAWMLLRQDL